MKNLLTATFIFHKTIHFTFTTDTFYSLTLDIDLRFFQSQVLKNLQTSKLSLQPVGLIEIFTNISHKYQVVSFEFIPKFETSFELLILGLNETSYLEPHHL